MSGAYKTNGCGSEKVTFLGKVFRPPLHIFFEACCNKHDELYGKGWKEIDRLVADLLFLHYMKEDIRSLSLLCRPYYYIWAYLYYIGVRLFWKVAFNYRHDGN